MRLFFRKFGVFFILMGAFLFPLGAVFGGGGGGPFTDTYAYLYNHAYDTCLLKLYTSSNNCNQTMIDCVEFFFTCGVQTSGCTYDPVNNAQRESGIRLFRRLQVDTAHRGPPATASAGQSTATGTSPYNYLGPTPALVVVAGPNQQSPCRRLLVEPLAG